MATGKKATRQGRKAPKQPRRRSTKTEGAPCDAARHKVDYCAWFERTPDPVLLIHEDGQFVDANPAACELTGYSHEELCGMTVGDLAAASDEQEAQPTLREMAQACECPGNRAIVRKDGTQRAIDCRIVDLDAGLFQATLRDITSPASRFDPDGAALSPVDRIARAVQPAVVVAREDGRIASWNEAAENVFGYTAAEAVGMPTSTLIPTAQRTAHAAGFKRLIDTAQADSYGRSISTVATRKDGSRVCIEIALSISRNGAESLVTAVILDVTEHREMVEQLYDALQRLQFHIQRMPLAYIVWDTDFRVEEWNPAAEYTFGYTKAEAAGRRSDELVVPPDAISTVATIWTRLLAGDESSHSINDNLRKDGTRITCEWFNTPLRDSTGRIHGVASMAMDVSEREAIESQLRDSQRLESLGVMASGVAHDFNSALMVILGNATLLRNIKGLPASALEYVQPIEDAGTRASELIKHLLAYARTGRHKPQPTDLNTVIREAQDFVAASIGKDVDLDLQLAPKLPTLRADRSQLEQILLNLCLNAKQAMGTQGVVHVATSVVSLNRRQISRCVPHGSEPGAYVELRVSDTGCGMSDDIVQRIYDPFFTTKPEGHGLGLAAVLGILRQHNGMTAVESEIGHGTTVRVYFPVVTEKQAALVKGDGNRRVRRKAKKPQGGSKGK